MTLKRNFLKTLDKITSKLYNRAQIVTNISGRPSGRFVCARVRGSRGSVSDPIIESGGLLFIRGDYAS